MIENGLNPVARLLCAPGRRGERTLRLKILVGVCALVAVAFAQAPSSTVLGGGYGGPSILSRGVVEAGRRGEDPLRFRFFGQVNTVYDSGLLPISVDPRGQVYSDALWGVEAGVGVYGYHSGRHSAVGLDYRGNFRHYSQNTYYDGSEHILSLDYTAQVSRRVAVLLNPTAGTFSRSFGSFGLYSSVLAIDPMSVVPTADLFDNRTYFAEGGGSLIFQKSSRLSFRAGGQGFTVRRQSKALVDLEGYNASGDVAYRLNRSQTVYGAYIFTHYGFGDLYGSSDAHMAILGHSIRIGRNVEFDLAGGGVRLESKGLQRVQVDPAIAALVGQTSTIQAFYVVNYIPSVNASLTRKFRKSSIEARYGMGVSPGNGVFLTSRRQIAGVMGGYTGIRRWDISGGVAYTQIKGVGFIPGGYGTYTGGGAASYRVNGLLHLSARAELRRADLTFTGFRRDAARLSFGIVITPGEVPVSLW